MKFPPLLDLASIACPFRRLSQNQTILSFPRAPGGNPHQKSTISNGSPTEALLPAVGETIALSADLRAH
jgi:hypothetical protein